MQCEHGWHDKRDCDQCDAEKKKRITELEAALREIAAGEIDEGGSVRIRQDSMQIAHRALYPND